MPNPSELERQAQEEAAREHCWHRAPSPASAPLQLVERCCRCEAVRFKDHVGTLTRSGDGFIFTDHGEIRYRGGNGPCVPKGAAPERA